MTPDLAFQASLLDGGPPSVDPSFTGLQRVALDETSWVDHVPGWLSGSDVVFGDLLSTGKFVQRDRMMYDRRVPDPRLTAGWSTDPTDGELPAILPAMTTPLSARYGVVFDRIWVNLYRDGQDSVAWHGDRNAKVHLNPLVATVSLGARRRFLLRPRGGGPARHVFTPGHGDLIVMGGACQHNWEHTVPKSTQAVGPRMSVTIRHSQGELLPEAPRTLDAD
ncbi:MAG TPA: alpha-ketoglutarate-dependent dioxygenase AlkB [Mycobacteriales bacterium]|nr:alpha-ketoglutarate-dependent dioxygenase AlkB [Mycobacteriales bacterium]